MKRILISGICSLSMLLAAAPTAMAQTVGPVMNQNGAARLSWNYRGGTCTIRYTEASESMYKYATSAGCDDGGIVIGGLVPGVRYKFQVSPDGVNWSKVVSTVAKNWVSTSATWNQTVNDDGAVRLVWGQRGGTCYVRYTEANQRDYKYATSTSCDDGQIVISQLVTGRKYRFQISQDWMNWSRPIVARARRTVNVTIAAAPVTQPTVAMTTAWTAANSMGNGTVRVMWAQRGGTCNVRYNESNQPGYKYATSAGCDDGGVTIGSLVVGQRYKFQVAQNDWSSWSRPVRATAR